VDETIKKLEQQDKKLDAIYASAEKTRKYLLWTLTITVAVIVVPLIGLPFAKEHFGSAGHGFSTELFTGSVD